MFLFYQIDAILSSKFAAATDCFGQQKYKPLFPSIQIFLLMHNNKFLDSEFVVASGYFGSTELQKICFFIEINDFAYLY